MQTSFVLDEPTSYNVFVHYHIMKNAGTTLSAILQREFNGAYAEVHGPDPGSMISGSELLAFIKEHPQIRAISSHHIRFPIPVRERLHFSYCCFIRHPLDRLLSLYTFFRATKDGSGIGQMAQLHSPADFFREMIDRFPNYVCNVQTSYLACHGFFVRPPDREDLRLAVRVMQESTVPGAVHRTHESLAAAEYFLNPVFPGIRLHYSPQNVHRHTNGSIADRERELKEVCGRKVYSELIALNRLDMQLLKRTEEEIERRTQLVPSFDHRLQDFEQRCLPSPELSQPLRAPVLAARRQESSTRTETARMTFAHDSWTLS